MKKTIIIMIILLIIVSGGVYFWLSNKDDSTTNQNSNNKIINKTDKPTLEYIPSVEADQRFGFLIGPSADEMKLARETGAGWIRPHPGAFIWGDMQKSATSDIDFSPTDNLVKMAQQYDLHILPTIWHYAKWDQLNNSDPDSCLASTEEFEQEFGPYRCPPSDYDAYSDWISAIVERYDGDGIDDMPGLTIPIKYWEVMNEPDLATPDGSPGLQFLIGQPSDYAKMLKVTSSAIHKADSDAKVVIAGAAGGSGSFIDYYRKVFSDEETIDAFDIANVHCISNNDVDTFNVKPYAEMLSEYGIDKPIWVTEAEAYISQDQDEIAAQLETSSANAFDFGAEKIFYTSMDLNRQPGGDHKEKDLLPKKDDGPQASNEIYQKIFNSI